MALNLDVDNAYAYRSNVWTGGDCSVFCWVYKTATVSRALGGFVESADGTDLSLNRDPAARLLSAGGPSFSADISNAAGTSSSDTSASTYSTGTWNAVGMRLVGSSYNCTVEVVYNGTPTGSPGAARDATGVDLLQLGNGSVSESDAHVAHFAVWNRALSDSEWTELNTTLPSAVSGGAPTLYESFIGSAGSFTLSAATIDSTYDSALPSLSSGGSSGVRGRGLLMGVG